MGIREVSKDGISTKERMMTVETIGYDSPVDALVALTRAYAQRYHVNSAEFFAQYQEGFTGRILEAAADRDPRP